MDGAKLITWFYFFLPFQFALLGAGASDLPIMRVLVPLIFLGWLTQSFFLQKVTLPKPVTLFALTTFLLFALLSVFWSENASWALRKALFWLSFFPLFLVLIDWFRLSQVRAGALSGLVWGGTAAASLGIVQFFSQFFLPLPQVLELSFKALGFFLGPNFASTVALYPSILVNIGGTNLLRAFAFFPDPHIFAYYSGMILPLALYQAVKKKTLFSTLCASLLFFGVILSFSRASYFAFLITLFLLGTLFLWQYRKSLSIGAILLGVTLAAALLLSPLTTRFTSSFSGEDAGVLERSRLLQEAVVHIGDAPFLGVGLGNYPLLVKPAADLREPIYVHNLYLDLAVEIGLIGLILFLMFIVSCLPRFALSKTSFFSYRLALFSSLSIFLIHSLFEYPLFSVHILILLLTLLAFLYVEKSNS